MSTSRAFKPLHPRVGYQIAVDGNMTSEEIMTPPDPFLLFLWSAKKWQSSFCLWVVVVVVNDFAAMQFNWDGDFDCV